MNECTELPYRIVQRIVRSKRSGTSDIKLNVSKAELCRWLLDRGHLLSLPPQRTGPFGAFADVTILEAESQSKSIILKGTLDSESVVLKVFFGWKGVCHTDDNSLEVEQFIYSRVVPELRKLTPNVVECIRVDTIWDFQPDRDLSALVPAVRERFRKRMEAIGRKDKARITALKKLGKKANTIDFRKLQMVVTKRMDGHPMRRWVHEILPSMGEAGQTRFLKDVLLQLATTLMVFKQFRLMHNDLHLGNIFVERLRTPNRRSFKLGDRHYEYDVQFWVQIYDFDRSTVRSSDRMGDVDNAKLADGGGNSCKKYGACNDFRPLADWFRCLWSLYQYAPGPMRTAFHEPMLSKESRSFHRNNYWGNGDKDAWEGFACLCTNRECVPCMRVDLREHVMLEHKFIQKYYRPINK